MADLTVSIAQLESCLRILDGRCEHCGDRPATWAGAWRTAYDWDGEGCDPNRAQYMCDDCNERDREFWLEMWSHANAY